MQIDEEIHGLSDLPVRNHRLAEREMFVMLSKYLSLI